MERARRAAELAYLREMGLQAASAQYGPEAVSKPFFSQIATAVLLRRQVGTQPV